MSVPDKYSHINFKPSESTARAAKRGLELRSEFGRGGTSIGIARARDMANRKDLSPSTWRRVKAFFDRHASNIEKGQSELKKSGKYTNGLIASYLWGHTAGRSQAAKIVRQMEAADKKAKAKDMFN